MAEKWGQICLSLHPPLHPRRHATPLMLVERNNPMTTQSPSTRTSLTDPLRIDELQVPGTPGRIGITFCPGKHAPSAHGAPWQRDVVQKLGITRGGFVLGAGNDAGANQMRPLPGDQRQNGVRRPCSTQSHPIQGRVVASLVLAGHSSSAQATQVLRQRFQG